MSKKSIKIFLYRLLGKVYIPHQLRDNNENVLLHISDTPDIFYPSLKNIIDTIKPKYIVHTGDMVDNIKLELFPGYLSRYERKIKMLISILENSSAEEIYLCIGNHDNKELVKNISKRSNIIEGCKKVIISDINFTLSHFPEDILKNSSEYNLFGHNLIVCNIEMQNKIYLNGIVSINIINLKNGEIFKLPYPFGIDENRLGKGRVGF